MTQYKTNFILFYYNLFESYDTKLKEEIQREEHGRCYSHDEFLAQITHLDWCNPLNSDN